MPRRESALHLRGGLHLLPCPGGGAEGKLFQTMHIDLNTDKAEKMKTHQQYDDKNIMQEKSGRSIAIARVTMKVEQHANAIDKDMEQIKEQMMEQKTDTLDMKKTFKELYPKGAAAAGSTSSSPSSSTGGPPRPWKADQTVMGGFDEASLPEERAAVMTRILMDTLPEDLSEEWLSPYASGR